MWCSKPPGTQRFSVRAVSDTRRQACQLLRVRADGRMCAGSAWPAVARAAGQEAVDVAAGADAELGEDLAQMVLDRAGTDEQPGADLRVGQPLAGQPRDLGLLRGQRLTGLAGPRAGGPRGPLADGLA